MRVFIAEKPEVAKAIAEALGGGKRTATHFECGNDLVTWCYGHLLELCEPEEYDAKYAKWDIDDLPIVPIPYKKKVIKDKEIQLKAIISLVKRADVIVNAGDADAEGQYLVDEILDLCGDLSHKQIKRVFINDNNIEAVQKVLSNLKDNSDYHFLRESAEARAVGDFFYGINLSRLYTIKAKEAGAQDFYTVGRVQTPILGLVVRRDREFLSHQKQYYYKIIGDFKFDDIGNDDKSDDEDIIDLNFGSLKTGSQGECLSADWKKLETKPRPLYTMDSLLNDLTRVANYVLDANLKKVLIDKDKGKEGEHGGIGTPATRDEILKGLFERGFLVMKGKTVISTEKGRAFYDVLPDSAKYPDMTALWHQQFQEIELGALSKDDLIESVISFIKNEVEEVKSKGLNLSHIKAYKCPKCGAALSQLKGKNGLFWACNAYKTTGCDSRFPDKNNMPDFSYVKPDISPYKCLVCGNGLIRRRSLKNPKLFFWSCSNYPKCKTIYPDAMGKPNFNQKP